VNVNTEKGNTFEVTLAFFGPKGNSFGQTLTVKVRVNEELSQEKVFRAAITMTEAGIASFDDCVEALKKFKGDEDAACQFLIDQNFTATKQ
jgi:hypothetical protein